MGKCSPELPAHVPIAINVAGFSTTARGTITTFSPKALSFVDLPAAANKNVDIQQRCRVHRQDGAAGLQIVDVSDRNAPHIVGSLVLPGSANDARVLGDRAYVAAGSARPVHHRYQQSDCAACPRIHRHAGVGQRRGGSRRPRLCGRRTVRTGGRRRDESPPAAGDRCGDGDGRACQRGGRGRYVVPRSPSAPMVFRSST